MEKEYILDAMTKIKENLESIDKYIELYSEGWNLNRLAKIDLAVLRIAVYEILYSKDIPIEVSINEAIEIVKNIAQRNLLSLSMEYWVDSLEILIKNKYYGDKIWIYGL